MMSINCVVVLMMLSHNIARQTLRTFYTNKRGIIYIIARSIIDDAGKTRAIFATKPILLPCSYLRCVYTKERCAKHSTNLYSVILRYLFVFYLVLELRTTKSTA